MKTSRLSRSIRPTLLLVFQFVSDLFHARCEENHSFGGAGFVFVFHVAAKDDDGAVHANVDRTRVGDHARPTDDHLQVRLHLGGYDRGAVEAERGGVADRTLERNDFATGEVTIGIEAGVSVRASGTRSVRGSVGSRSACGTSGSRHPRGASGTRSPRVGRGAGIDSRRSRASASCATRSARAECRRAETAWPHCSGRRVSLIERIRVERAEDVRPA